MASQQNCKKDHRLAPSFFIQSWQTTVDQVSSGGHSSVLDVPHLDSKGHLTKNSTTLQSASYRYRQFSYSAILCERLSPIPGYLAEKGHDRRELAVPVKFVFGARRGASDGEEAKEAAHRPPHPCLSAMAPRSPRQASTMSTPCQNTES